MKKHRLELKLESPTLIGSGEGFGSLVDTDIVFDEVGIPFVPSKRIKGCLRDSASEADEMFRSSGITFPTNIEKTFGKAGSSESAPAYFSNLFIENYEENKAWLKYYLKNGNYPGVLSRERILETFTEIRWQTAINPDGVAQPHSLRTIRVVKKGIIFYGDVHIEKQDEAILNTLSVACLNFRLMGTKRNRGFGEVRCTLLNEDDTEFPIQKKLEKIVCTV
ncbi:RAMP superfamily CRISPR-associated protein [Desulfococcaceae bacterium HSG8]|nr:RAMP superfamily CRISPR-associated protein [Desulfococcaceae bacterium HSG8]